MSGRHRKAFSSLQSCLTGSSRIHLILLITGRNKVLAKVIFSQVSVIHSVHRGGGLVPAVGGWRSPNFWGVSPILGGGGSPNFRGSPIFLGGSPNFQGSPIFWGGLHWNTVNTRPVRILLECILVKVIQYTIGKTRLTYIKTVEEL